MSSFFYGIPGKIKTLVDRLTSARAANLDNLNATVSSRAAASTALSNAVWTDTRAGKLDNAVLKSDPLVAAPIALIPSDPRDTTDHTSDYMSYIAGLALGTTISTSYVDIVNYTGQGVIEFCALVSYGTTVSIRLTIDGVTVGSGSVAGASSNYNSKVLVGLFAAYPTGASGSFSLGQVPFYTSLVIQAKISTTGTAYVYYKYRKTA